MYMRDLERRLHEGNRSEKLDQQIITGEANPKMHNCALSRLTWAAEGPTESHPAQEGEAADEEQPRRTHKERFRLQWAHVISPSKEWKRGFDYSPNAYIEVNNLKQSSL